MHPTSPQLLSIAASALFISLLPIRLMMLRAEPIKVVSEHRGHGKLAIAILLSVVQLATLVTIAFTPAKDDFHLFSAVASFVACVGLCPLLALEHTRSVKPSDLGIVYLLVSTACDFAELGTGQYGNTTLEAVTPGIVNLCVKFVLLVAESRGKKPILRDPRGQQSPEELANILDRTFFWWINPILALGNRHVLTEENLPPMGHMLSSKALRQQALRAWDQRAKPEGRTTLPKVLALSMLPQFLAPIIPRLFLIVFRYAQPVLISTAIRYMSGSSSAQSMETGHLIIAMAVVIYVGLAMTRAVYYHRLNQLKVMIRGAVVGLINNKSFSQKSSNHDDGRAVTLISTDAGNVGQAASMFHETWAQVIEVLLGTTMLAREVGWVCLVPYVIIFFCSRMSRHVAKHLQSKQKDWSMATQKRLAVTTSMLSSMKSLKMLGVATHTESLVHDLRLQELKAAQKVRWMMVAYNASANALGIFTPIITFVLFVLVASLKGSALDAETAFTTTALLGLVTHPANMIMSIVPQAIGSLAAFERIQDYLLQAPRNDQRLALKKTEDSPDAVSPAICVENVTIQSSPMSPPILTNISLVIDRGSIVICSGPVGSGKTTLVKSLMGELPAASGTISVSSMRVGYCEQSPWLPSGTLREAVRGFLPDEPSWYEQVIRLCCLDEDLSALPNGDQTMIGSRGLNLSGGQRQRVALARAVYARCEMVFLDDSFSALDGKTESRIVENLLGPTGFFKNMGTTVFLVANSSTHFHLADSLVILDNGTVAYQGTWAGLTQDPEHVLKLHIGGTKKNITEEDPKVDKTIRSQSLKVDEAASDLSRATGDVSLYGYYLRAVGFRNFLLLLVCTSSYSFFITFPQYWLQKWTAAPASQTMFYAGGYIIVSFLAWAFTNGSMWSTHICIAPDSGANLHRRLLSTIISAPLSYFSTTDTGVILNRLVITTSGKCYVLTCHSFSQDIQLVDRQLPPAILSISNQVFKLLVQLILLFSAQKLMATTLPLCVVTVYFVQRIYLRTSRQLRLLDLESQSAVYSSFLESVEGVRTIRAFGWERQVEAANIRSLDKSQQPAYILFCLQQWLGVVLDLMVAAIATGLIALAIFLRGTTTAGQIGMALNIVIVANASLLGLVTSWTNMEISLGAISRLKTLEADTPKEGSPLEDYVPAGAWPSSGLVELDSVTVSYNPEAVALQDVTLKVSEGQQLVICGRTGSGKSTLLLALLRLLDVQSGTIKIDGVDLSLVPRDLIRQRCFITVSQDAFILGQASLRFNLDPSGSLSNDTIVAALQRTSMWSHFEAGDFPPKELHEILESPISSLPQMSTGQSQLFALARAILRLQSLRETPNLSGAQPDGSHVMPILLLDEATSSLDPETEVAMRDIIHQEFIEKGHTVIAITHRLGGVTGDMRSDRDFVALLSKGKIEKVGRVEDVLGTLDSQK
ncbi:Putative AAA+ ATPase domain, ABC transporter type 1, transmembrane domain-containing protein [Colletotrichum destructivum]|uniref:AAA+ ATPase domain, ABC transporter type 1, transmembrane domain-containing protein n=1 Tax=Colletotrichum destructivum TaxID=34406 RepID=A0AAX4IGG1_9PEZI|nr:Putative AAA+ ATPase domain, ABC transporter type 1, transmembrane domain-containing protein [Colletotrichum destructivum]